MKKSKVPLTRPLFPNPFIFSLFLFRLLFTRYLTNYGYYHNKLIARIKKYLSVDNIHLFSSGHIALEAALQTLPIRGEVITTAFTFASTTQALLRTGFQPVFCDISSDDLNIDVRLIEDLITPKTVAILAVHVFGNPCDVVSIDRIAKKYNLKVIYDAAHTFGAKFKSEHISNFGDISMLSFHATKVFNTVEGGALVFKDSNLDSYFRSIGNFGLNSDSYPSIHPFGFNGKLNEISSLIGLLNLNKVQQSIVKRKIISNHYKVYFSNFPGVQLIPDKNDFESNYSYFPILLESENVVIGVQTHLKNHGVDSKRYFYPLMTKIDYDFITNPIPLPVSDYATSRILLLPIYPDLKSLQVKNIAELIISYIKIY